MTNGNRSEPPFYIEKALEYTVKGVEILREETIQLFNNRNSYLSWGSAAITLLFYSAATSNYNYPFLTYIMLLVMIPLLSCSLIIVSLDVNRQIIKLSRYLRSREKLINLLLELTLTSDQSTNNSLKSPQLYHLRKQLPIYWEHQFSAPTVDLKENYKIKDIDSIRQCHLTTWIFTIVALTSYITGLCFQVTAADKPQNGFYNDINIFTKNFGFFSAYYKSFQEIITKLHCLEILFPKNWHNWTDSAIFIITIIAFSLSIKLLSFILSKLQLRKRKLCKSIKSIFNFIAKPYDIALFALAIIVISLRFYLSIVILIGIFGTFIYSNFWQIPKLNKIAQEPLALDFTNILPENFFRQEEENWSGAACVQMLLADKGIYIPQTLIAAMIGNSDNVDILKIQLEKLCRYLKSTQLAKQVLIVKDFKAPSIRCLYLMNRYPFVLEFQDQFLLVNKDKFEIKIYDPKANKELELDELDDELCDKTVTGIYLITK